MKLYLAALSLWVFASCKMKNLSSTQSDFYEQKFEFSMKEEYTNNYEKIIKTFGRFHFCEIHHEGSDASYGSYALLFFKDRLYLTGRRIIFDRLVEKENFPITLYSDHENEFFLKTGDKSGRVFKCIRYKPGVFSKNDFEKLPDASELVDKNGGFPEYDTPEKSLLADNQIARDLFGAAYKLNEVIARRQSLGKSLSSTKGQAARMILPGVIAAGAAIAAGTTITVTSPVPGIAIAVGGPLATAIVAKASDWLESARSNNFDEALKLETELEKDYIKMVDSYKNHPDAGEVFNLAEFILDLRWGVSLDQNSGAFYHIRRLKKI